MNSRIRIRGHNDRGFQTWRRDREHPCPYHRAIYWAYHRFYLRYEIDGVRIEETMIDRLLHAINNALCVLLGHPGFTLMTWVQAIDGRYIAMVRCYDCGRVEEWSVSRYWESLDIDRG